MTISRFAALLAAPLLLAQPALGQDRCPALRWTTLGTAGGPIPTLDRSEPANLLDAANRTILVDSGDAAATQIARLGRSIGDVDTVFISHLHWDHTGGLAAVLGLRWMNNFETPITIYGPPGMAQVVDGIIASLRPQERVGFGTGARVADPAANITVYELADGEGVTVDDLRVTARINTHYDFPEEQIGTTSLSYRFVMGDRAITYSGDTGPSPALTELAQGSDLLVTEVMALEPLVASITAQRPDMPPQVRDAMRQHLATHHIDAGEVGRTANTAAVKHVVLTHFAVPPGPLHDHEAYLRAGVRQSYVGPVDLARDLSSFDVGCD